MKKFKIFWLHGVEEEIEGYDIADAFMRACYGGGALRALDYWKEIKDKSENSSND